MAITHVKALWGVLLAVLTLLHGVAAEAGTLDDVRQRGFVNCGVAEAQPGFSIQDKDGIWRGFDADFCRAVGAAVLGDADRVQFVPLAANAVFTALANRTVDLAARQAAWTLSDDIGKGAEFPVITYYDGMGFLTRIDPDISKASDLAGQSICVEAGSAPERALKVYATRIDAVISHRRAKSGRGMGLAYRAGKCGAVTGPVSSLAAIRSNLSEPGQHIILPDIIVKLPMGPVVRRDDPVWRDAVRWTYYALVLGEELGVSSQRVGAPVLKNGPPNVRLLLGIDGNLGQHLGLSRGWAEDVIGQVGHYGEIFQPNLGTGSTINLQRGLNALWTEGGLHYGPPVQ